MERWSGKIAVVTGASAGIGAAITVDLANAGLIVIGLARRPERVDKLKSKLTGTGSIVAYNCDVSKEIDVKATFAYIIANFGGIDVLVNNAGIVRDTQLLAKNNSIPIRQVLDTNVMAVMYCTREAFQSMKSRNVDGHIIIINSILGHNVLQSGTDSLNMYAPSKFAVTAMTEVLRQEFQSENTKVKVTSISPGLVRTEIAPSQFYAYYADCILEAEDISQGVLYVLGTPPRVQVHELTIKPIGERN